MTTLIEKVNVEEKIILDIELLEQTSQLLKNIETFLKDKYIGKFRYNIFIFNIENIKLGELNTIGVDSFGIETKFDLIFTRFFVGKVLYGAEVMKTHDVLTSCVYSLIYQESKERKVILLLTELGDKKYKIGDTINLVISGIKMGNLTKKLYCSAIRMTASTFLNFTFPISFPRALSHFNKNPKRFGRRILFSSEFVEDEKSAVKGGAIGITDFYQTKFGDKYRIPELINGYIISKLISKKPTIVDYSVGKKFKKEFEALNKKISKKGLIVAPQNIIFLSDKKKIPSIYKFENPTDIIIYDGPLEDIPDNIIYIDLFNPLCSDKYFTILTSDGFEDSRDYCNFVFRLYKRMNQDINSNIKDKFNEKKFIDLYHKFAIL